MTWEPVDGQHILHACQKIAYVEVGHAGGITKEVFANRFLRHLVYTVVYDDTAYYVHESHRLKAHHFVRRKFATVGKTLRKIRDYGNTMANPQESTRTD